MPLETALEYSHQHQQHNAAGRNIRRKQTMRTGIWTGLHDLPVHGKKSSHKEHFTQKSAFRGNRSATVCGAPSATAAKQTTFHGPRALPATTMGSIRSSAILNF